jgi:hypothetical protein
MGNEAVLVLFGYILPCLAVYLAVVIPRRVRVWLPVALTASSVALVFVGVGLFDVPNRNYIDFWPGLRMVLAVVFLASTLIAATVQATGLAGRLRGISFVFLLFSAAPAVWLAHYFGVEIAEDLSGSLAD